ncbi:unnamed protein product [Trichogramma brassicae]|uniref:Uncharacterized protein n=1 Tax=Trichogramma brassicae TaxID=86971 RepID=A0A6H5I255_9HYME|nr:unnamed protein product [Trichogramma brassicae]
MECSVAQDNAKEAIVYLEYAVGLFKRLNDKSETNRAEYFVSIAKKSLLNLISGILTCRNLIFIWPVTLLLLQAAQERERCTPAATSYVHFLANKKTNWTGQYPNLRDIFEEDEIDWLLTESISFHDKGSNNCPGELIIKFVANSGYKDQPKIEQDGKPLERRTTAVHHVARSGFLNRDIMVRDLFKIYNNFEINYTDETGLTHFHVACVNHGCSDVVEKFLEFGQDPNLLVPETGDSPLQLILSGGLHQYQAEIVRSLLRSGADPNSANKDGRTSLHVVCSTGLPVAVEVFLAITEDELRPLEIDARDKEGKTALHLALMFRNESSAELLLRKGADPTLTDNEGCTALHLICQYEGINDLVGMFFEINDELNRPVQIDALDKYGRTPLYLALENGQRKAVSTLLGRGADTFCKLPAGASDHQGSTPLHLICQSYFDDDSAEIFLRASEERHPELLARLIDGRDTFGRTPLQWAAARLLPNVCEALLNHGPDLSGFVLPTPSALHRRQLWVLDKLKLAYRALGVVECLQARGYELNPSDVLTIMTFLARNGFFDKSANSDTYDDDDDDEELARRAKETMINSDLSLQDLMQLSHREAVQSIPSKLNFMLLRKNNNDRWCRLEEPDEALVTRLCENLTRKFFRDCAVYPFWDLIHKRLPLECCYLIIEKLTNQDLYHICLAATGQSS